MSSIANVTTGKTDSQNIYDKLKLHKIETARTILKKRENISKTLRWTDITLKHANKLLQNTVKNLRLHCNVSSTKQKRVDGWATPIGGNAVLCYCWKDN